MLNKEFILNRITPILNKKREISEAEFLELFGALERKEQYEIIDILIENNIEYVDEKEEETKQMDKLPILATPNVQYEQLKNISNEMLCHMAQNGDTNATATLVEKNKRFIYQVATQVAKNFKENALTIEDLYQEGVLGILASINHFDESKDIKFVTYSWHWIRQKVERAIIDSGFVIRIPVHQFDKMIKVLACQRKNAHATVEDIAELLPEFSKDEIVDLLMISANYLNVTSLNTLVGENQDSELIEFVPCVDEILPEDLVISSAMQGELFNLLNRLNCREQEVLKLRYGLTGEREQTLEEIGRKYHVTRERVRQIEEKALRKLKYYTRFKSIDDFI